LQVSTCEPDYYRWTQWIFLQLHGRGLAYQAEVPVNWCPALGTVLANEEVRAQAWTLPARLSLLCAAHLGGRRGRGQPAGWHARPTGPAPAPTHRAPHHLRLPTALPTHLPS
jgi:hypothetical protein